MFSAICRGVNGSSRSSAPAWSRNVHASCRVRSSSTSCGRSGGSRCPCGRGTARARARRPGRRRCRPAAAPRSPRRSRARRSRPSPTSSRCSGPIDVTSATSGRAIAQSSRDLPEPAHPHLGDEHLASPARAGRRSAAGRSRCSGSRVGQTVGARRAQSAPRMSFVVVLPVEPTTATTRAPLFDAHEGGERGQRRVLVVGDERRGAARRAPRRHARRPC